MFISVVDISNSIGWMLSVLFKKGWQDVKQWTNEVWKSRVEQDEWVSMKAHSSASVQRSLHRNILDDHKEAVGVMC